MDAGEDRAHAQAGPGQQPGSSSIGPDRDGARSLEAFAIQHGLLFNYAWLMSLDPRDGGQQHETYVDLSEPSWRIKVTGPNLVLISKRRRIPELTALDYLNSCHLANIIFGDQIEFLGVIPTEEGPRLVIRQPEVEAADPDNPHPMKPAINRWLRSAGFEYEEGAWTRESDLVVVSDEHEGNFILAADGIRPIDLHLSRLPWAKGEVIPWNENPANPSRTAL